jgi:hypothetical protein
VNDDLLEMVVTLVCANACAKFCSYFAYFCLVGADPLSAAGSSSGQGAPQSALGPPMAPPQSSMSGHPMQPGGMANHPLIAAAREQERVYLDMLSRPPYSTDPIMAQQVWICSAIAGR